LQIRATINRQRSIAADGGEQGPGIYSELSAASYFLMR